MATSMHTMSVAVLQLPDRMQLVLDWASRGKRLRSASGMLKRSAQIMFHEEAVFRDDIHSVPG